MRNIFLDQIQHSFEREEHHLITSLTARQMPLKCHMISPYCPRCILNRMHRACDVIWSCVLIDQIAGHKSQQESY